VTAALKFMIMSIVLNYVTPNDLMTIVPEIEEKKKKRGRK